MPKEKTYCVNADCPFKKCDKHLQQLRKIKDKSQYIKVANLDSVCEDYLCYLLDEIEEGGATHRTKDTNNIKGLRRKS